MLPSRHPCCPSCLGILRLVKEGGGAVELHGPLAGARGPQVGVEACGQARRAGHRGQIGTARGTQPVGKRASDLAGDQQRPAAPLKRAVRTWTLQPARRCRRVGVPPHAPKALRRPRGSVAYAHSPQPRHTGKRDTSSAGSGQPPGSSSRRCRGKHAGPGARAYLWLAGHPRHRAARGRGRPQGLSACSCTLVQSASLCVAPPHPPQVQRRQVSPQHGGRDLCGSARRGGGR